MPTRATVTSNVPPPKSYTSRVLPDVSSDRPYAYAAAEGSAMSPCSVMPAARHACSTASRSVER